jgi:hypothetical protein
MRERHKRIRVSFCRSQYLDVILGFLYVSQNKYKWLVFASIVTARFPGFHTFFIGYIWIYGFFCSNADRYRLL